MTLQELRYIIALADTGNFQRAAVQCHISQPTLSQQVKKLEEYLGVVLFDRSLRRIVPTVVGVQVVASARLMIEEANRIREIARGGLDPMRRTLKLGVIPTVGPYLLPRILGAIHRTHPALFRSTAEGETGHAHGHLEYLEQCGDPATGLPFGRTADNLKSAVAGETHEYTDMYPGMAKDARAEGFEEVADWFETLAKAERSHANRYQKALKELG